MRIGIFLDPRVGVLASKSGGEIIKSMVETKMSSHNKEIIKIILLVGCLFLFYIFYTLVMAWQVGAAKA